MRVLDSAVRPRSRSYLTARNAALAALADLGAALDAAREGGGERAVTRHHARGKLLARERIELLVDRDSPLLELSPIAGWGSGTAVGAAVVTGIGVVEERLCMLVATEPTVRDGAVTAATIRKVARAQQIAYENRLPVLHLIETAGVEPVDEPDVFRRSGQLVVGLARLAAGRIPTVGVCFGEPRTLGGADLAWCSDEVVALNRPGIGQPAGDAGGGGGAGRPADHVAEDERDAVRLARQCVRRLPPTAGESPVAVAPKYDPEDLLAVPVTEPREVLARLLDGSGFDEARPGSGNALCAGWGAVHGYRVAVLADGAGLAGPAEADKAVALVDRAALTGTPLLFLRHGGAAAARAETAAHAETAVPAAQAEATAQVAQVARAETAIAAAVARAGVPVVTVRVGTWRGLSAVPALARFRFAWPGADAAIAPPAAAGRPERGGREGDGREDAAGDSSGAVDLASSALYLSGELDDDGVIDPRDTRTVVGICLSVIHSGRS